MFILLWEFHSHINDSTTKVWSAESSDTAHILATKTHEGDSSTDVDACERVSKQVHSLVFKSSPEVACDVIGYVLCSFLDIVVRRDNIWIDEDLVRIEIVLAHECLLHGSVVQVSGCLVLGCREVGHDDDWTAELVVSSDPWHLPCYLLHFYGLSIALNI